MVTREEILKIAKLSKLSVTEEELDGLTAAMGEIIAFADTINAAGAAAGEFDNINNLQNAFREDEVVPSYPRDEILKNVDGGEDGFFPVRKRQ
ncbi:MAG: Asp-tRNA(Asn)/Glu-tRNA(Gln) amidotransferase subunit GatC [Oscillospiraceae bacterium]|jgi:aspartyl/glutamyl-tRNA(Asn/Gln) amidotransferase, C subunit|nr:Asp-tRNA(Asn)/Glu-tRNA(Gln) amidotransferase subunit GatC [Oscillospiraceae bacterium]